MTTIRATIWPHELVPLVPPELVSTRLAQAAGSEPVSRVRITISPEDETGNALGEPFRKELLRPRMISAPMDGNGMRRDPSQPPFSIELPSDFARVTLDYDGRSLVFERDELVDPVPDTSEATHLFKGGRGFVITIIAEMFDTWSQFEAKAEEFILALRALDPFWGDDVGQHLGFELIFEPSPIGGHFATQKGIENMLDDPNERRIYGDNPAVHDYVAKPQWRRPQGYGARDLMLVVINSDVRGGAGMATKGDPAWTTTENLPLTLEHAEEKWVNVAIHEVGHAFELDDEYSHPLTPLPAQLGKNVTQEQSFDDAPWGDFDPDNPEIRIERGPTGGPTLAANQAQGSRDDWKGVLGTFEGAFYNQTGWYRPAYDCRMRNTDQPFCPWCQELIKRLVQERVG